MKKYLSFVLIFLIVLTISGCENFNTDGNIEGPIDTVRTKITVDSDNKVSFLIDSIEPKWEELVNALDGNGDALTITKEMINTDQVNMNTEGTFDVVYSLKDDLGNELEFVLEVTVYIVGIELIGDNHIYIDLNSEYTDEGYTLVNPYNVAATVSIENTVDTSISGDYTITYSLNEYDYEITRYVHVMETVYANGVYDLSNLNNENRAILYTALERYLLENVIGGVPLYNTGTAVMYSNRMNLYSDEYNAVFGFGEEYSSISTDDSHVIMNDLEYGNIGEYTFRKAFSFDFETYNPWESTTASNNDILNLTNGSLYTLSYGENIHDFTYTNELASKDPMPIDAEVIDGVTLSNTWQISIKEDLTWSYNENTDTSSLEEGHEILDANDFYDTWKLALDNDWYKSYSGGSDFITYGIVNVEEYIDGTVSFDNVGIKLIDDHTLELTFDENRSSFDVKHMFYHNFTPINTELYQSLGDDWGTSYDKVASSGIYILEEYNENNSILLTKNDNFTNRNQYHFTNIEYTYCTNDDQIFEMFLEGKLDFASVPDSRYEEFSTDSRLIIAPTNTTFKLLINGFGTEENRDSYINMYSENSISDTFVPEPILMYTEMKQALYSGLDRQTAVDNMNYVLVPEFTYFAPHYFISNDGLSIRSSQDGQALLDYFSQDTLGYDPDTALLLFKEAVSKAVSDGYYQAGTLENPTIIELEIAYVNSGNLMSQNTAEELKRQYEALFYDDVNHVKLEIILQPYDFSEYYHYFMLSANFDLGIGGISGSIITPPGFFEVFRDDNQSGFTMNYGIDTTTANILVRYMNNDGSARQEIWSFNALEKALFGPVQVVNGMESDSFYGITNLLNLYAQMDGYEIDTTTDVNPSFIAGLLGITLEDFLIENDIDSITGIHAITTTGEQIIYVIEETDNEMSLFAQYYLSETPLEALSYNQFFESSFVDIGDSPLSEEELLSNTYFNNTYDLTSLEELLEYIDITLPLDLVEIYEIEWSYGSDLYAFVKYEDLYIAIYWL